MKKLILIIALFLIIIAVGIFVYEKNQIKESQQTAQDLRIQRDISAIRKFADSADLAVQYESESKSSNGEKVPVGIYIAGSDRYEVDVNSGKIIEFGSRNLPIGSENEKKYDYTARYNQQELKTKAKQFIAENADIDLDKLTLIEGNKELNGTKNYFFRWEDKSQKTTEGYPFIQVGFTQGGTLISYTNTLTY
jgi:uncharacterized protein YxeA